MICERRKSEEERARILDKTLKALKSGLGYNLEDIRGEQFKGDKIGRARRIVCQQLRDDGFNYSEVGEILRQGIWKVELYTWSKKQVERKDAYQREKSRFCNALKRLEE